jgi:hypothetical protein
LNGIYHPHPYENRLTFYILYNDYLPKRSRKQDEDINVLAKSIVEKATKVPSEEKPEKNPAAVALGRLGGLKGGKARAEEAIC